MPKNRTLTFIQPHATRRPQGHAGSARPLDCVGVTRDYWFVRKFSEQAGRNVTGLSREARAVLSAYDWPGNVRELQNVIERPVVLGSTEVISPDGLFDLLPDIEAPAYDEASGFHDAVRQTRRRLIAGALERASGNVTEAARELRLHPNYLHRLMTTLGLREE